MLLLGVTDPLGFLSADRHDWDTTVAVIKAADQERVEQQRNIAALTANELAKFLVPHLQAIQASINAQAKALSRRP